MKKYFNVDNKYLAYGINYITGEKFMKFKNKETGNEYYTFKYSEKIYEAYNSMTVLKNNINK